MLCLLYFKELLFRCHVSIVSLFVGVCSIMFYRDQFLQFYSWQYTTTPIFLLTTPYELLYWEAYLGFSFSLLYVVYALGYTVMSYLKTTLPAGSFLLLKSFILICLVFSTYILKSIDELSSQTPYWFSVTTQLAPHALGHLLSLLVLFLFCFLTVICFIFVLVLPSFSEVSTSFRWLPGVLLLRSLLILPFYLGGGFLWCMFAEGLLFVSLWVSRWLLAR